MPNRVRPGRPVRLELNAQRVTAAFEFYQALFGWTSIPLHVPPWGSIPLLVNGDRCFGNQFMAMGAFAPPKWMIWFSGDLDRAEHAIKKLGGNPGSGRYQLGEVGTHLDATDPKGNPVSLVELREDPPGADQHGDPHMAEMWGKNSSDLAEFYAELFDLKIHRIPTGAMLADDEAPRLLLRDTDFDIQWSRWIPYFLSSSTGGDCERARRAGAVVQVHREIVPDIGGIVVLADPANTYFGMINPNETE